MQIGYRNRWEKLGAHDDFEKRIEESDEELSTGAAALLYIEFLKARTP